MSARDGTGRDGRARDGSDRDGAERNGAERNGAGRGEPRAEKRPHPQAREEAVRDARGGPRTPAPIEGGAGARIEVLATPDGSERAAPPKRPARRAPRSLRERVVLVRKSGEMHNKWYRQTYRDVAPSGLEPAEHYVRFGAPMGRSPGRAFDARAYRRAYPDAAAKGDPLTHYVLAGRDRGCHRRPPGPMEEELHRVARLRGELLGLGLTDHPLAELAAIAERGANPQARAAASRELALWSLRDRSEAGAREALARLAESRRAAPDLAFRRQLVVIELLCHHRLGQRAEAGACFDRAGLAGEMSADALLAFANEAETPLERCAWINRVLALHAVAPIGLLPGAGGAPYDRLTGAHEPPARQGGPKVTVLMAAYAAEDTIATALRSLGEQSWRDLEILVLDDASPDGTCAAVEAVAARDERVRLIRMVRNGGAYVARNRGLAEATGRYVTLHDADDWSHPLKIETQVRHLEANPRVVACTSEQARATPELRFARWTGKGAFVIRNVSSLMARREPLREALGGWDAVRFAADSELIRRLELAFGRRAVADLPTGPLSLQRDSDSSIIADEVMGMNGFYFGVRKEYFDAQRHHHASGASMRYDLDPTRRAFPVPPMMRPDRTLSPARPRRLDVVIAGDFRLPGPGLDAVIEEVARLRAEGRRVGLVELYDHEVDTAAKSVDAALRGLVDGEGVQMLVFGEEASCGELRFPAGRPERIDQRYLPRIAPDAGAPTR